MMMFRSRPLRIDPPLLNSANPWCSTLEQLQELYDNPHTGAVTTRTSTLDGFPHDEAVHQFTFYNPTTFSNAGINPTTPSGIEGNGSLNTLGYSPFPLQDYLRMIKTISDTKSKEWPGSDANDQRLPPSGLKPFIISITGSVEDVVKCYQMICLHQHNVCMALAMEVNLSCPNIPGKPPPAYSSTSLLTYLTALKLEVSKYAETRLSGPHAHIGQMHIPIGIKTPPYTYHDQFQQMVDALLASAKAKPAHSPCPINFITATNTLGSSLLLDPIIQSASSSLSASASSSPLVFQHVLNSANDIGIGGLAGAPLHPLALGNVYTIKSMLFQHQELNSIQIIGVGGVEDADSYKRMRAVGAAAVGVGTALGRKGVQVFKNISEGLHGPISSEI